MLLIENTIEEITYAGGLNTNKPANFGGLVTFTGGQINTNFVSNTTSTVLTAAQSGSTILFNQAAGITYTLPVPVVGMTFNFKVTTSVTSVGDKVITNSGSVFITGPISVGVAAGTSSVFFGDGTTIVSVNMNGTTTGGLIGSNFSLTAISPTVWLASGVLSGSGTVATPFANS